MEKQSGFATHLTQPELDGYRRRMIPAAELLAINEHLASCEECYGKFYPHTLLASTYKFARLELELAESEELEHLSFDQIAAYQAGGLDGLEREMVSVHLEICSECQQVIQDLRQFKTDLAVERPVVPVSAPPVSAPPAWWERVVKFWKTPGYRIPVEALAFGAAAAIIIWLVIGSRPQTPAELQAQVEDLKRQNSALKTDLSNVSELRAQVEQLRAQNRELQQLATVKPGGPAPPQPGGEVSSQPLVAINDGGRRVTLDRQGVVEGLKFVSPEHLVAVREALRTGRVETRPDLASLNGDDTQLMGGPDEKFVALSPVGMIVSTAQPVFRWTPLSGASGYTVTVYREDGEVCSSPVLTGTEWTAPPLPRGRIYSWQIRANKDNREIIAPAPDAPEARFRILSSAQLNELERAKQLYANSRLTLGVLYARMGLRDEAAAEFRT
ncbi:MAG TPA: zf-HC2 domain-containing protein, partial [Blastocatellia bacterium]|nr:zf-HC2 domain-containing protein [Blastocatellia bacterium]